MKHIYFQFANSFGNNLLYINMQPITQHSEELRVYFLNIKIKLQFRKTHAMAKSTVNYCTKG